MSQGPFENAGDPLDSVLDPDDEAERGTEYRADPTDEAIVTDPGANEYDTSWVPDDRPSHRTDFGTTLSEMREGESLDQLLSQEEPDVLAEIGEDDGGDPDRAAATDVEEDTELAEELVEYGGDTDLPAADYAEAEPRAGRLVADDEGAHTDAEKDLVARDLGISGGAASAEEAAVHITDEP